VLLMALVATCREGGAPTPSGLPITDAGYAGAPGRMVTDPPDGFREDLVIDGVRPGMGTTPIGGGSGGSGGSSGRTDARLPDRPADRPVDRPTSGCNLVRQDCPSGRGCYPGPGTFASCQPAGSLSENTPCGEDTACAPGYLCVDAFGGGSKLCQRICDATVVSPCPNSRTCQTFPGSTIGFCQP
jgi:hypothetical protein